MAILMQILSFRDKTQKPSGILTQTILAAAPYEIQW